MSYNLNAVLCAKVTTFTAKVRQLSLYHFKHPTLALIRRNYKYIVVRSILNIIIKFLNFIMNVSPECDCWNHNDAAIVPDLGIAASFDPVALDCACADIVNAAPAIPSGNRLADILSSGDSGACCHSHGHDDKFHHIHPDTCWKAGVEHASKIGLGNMEYELKMI